MVARDSFAPLALGTGGSKTTRKYCIKLVGRSDGEKRFIRVRHPTDATVVVIRGCTPVPVPC